jgi:nitrile hydratase accessory protein
VPHGCRDETSEAAAVARLLGHLDGPAAVPRRNGELVFDEPWQGRAFGMAVALHEQGLFTWEEFRQELIARIAAVESAGGPFDYYEAWLGAFERLLATRGLVSGSQLEETTFQFEFGERDEVF